MKAHLARWRRRRRITRVARRAQRINRDRAVQTVCLALAATDGDTEWAARMNELSAMVADGGQEATP